MEKPKLYVLKDPETLKIRYVGITIRKLQERLSGHMSDVTSRPDLNYHKICWIRSLLDKGLKPIIELVAEYETLDEVKIAEMEYIAKYKVEYNLTNCTIGGDHLGERSHTRESVLKKSTTRAISQYNIFGEHLRDFEMTEDAARFLNISSASKITMCCKHNRNHAHGYIWRYFGEELGDISKLDKTSICFNKLVQYNLDGEYIAHFDTFASAAIAVDDKSKGANIRSVILGKQRQCKGFLWKMEPNFEYINEEFIDKSVVNLRENKTGKDGISVCQYTLDRKFIRVFKTICEASNAVLGSINGRKQITNCCLNSELSYKNYKWSYAHQRSNSL